MRYAYHSVLLAAYIVAAPSFLLGEDELILPDVTVGQNLEVRTSIKVAEPASNSGVEITLTSGDSEQVLLSTAPNVKGTASIDVAIRPGRRESTEFYVQGVGKTGSTTFTANAKGFKNGTGTITVAPSGILITGGGGANTPADRLLTTVALGARNVRVFTALLDSSMHYVAPQLLAGGATVNLVVTSSDPHVGTVAQPELTILGGQATALTVFQPKAPGTTKLSVNDPPGFGSPDQFGQLTATVLMPGFGLKDQVTVGKNLQLCDSVLLGEPAPKDGRPITLSSDNPNLLISSEPSKPGSKSVTIIVPERQNKTQYCLQSLSDSGMAAITASAPGFTSRTATVNLAPSGVLLGFSGPDEADLFRKEAAEQEHGIGMDLSQGTAEFRVGTAWLHPVNHRGADITFQGLRPGISATVVVTSSDPSVGTVTSPVTLTGNGEVAVEFTALKEGKTIVSINTPDGFTVPGNTNSYTVVVR